ncbi:ATP-binding protein [Pedobacter sp. 22226]|uniref:ATP-binding protein n=1 Tax=Pedobacter sp. 22226 TaxID=3453894 RepID=UPI003F8415FC
MFQHYYRIENDLSKTTSGFGIGLYFCAEIISLHGGTIWLESEPGKRSTLHFTLPRY